MTENATSFGANARRYAEGRPGYPGELFDWIVSEAPGTACAIDIATGSGQAALSLAERFTHVFASDISEEQIAHAPIAPNITYAVASAEKTGFASGVADAVTVATALHWFDFPKFWEEVRRICKPGALFCGWTYGLTEAEPEVQRELLDEVLAIADPYWAEGNRLSLRGYQRDEIGFPFEEVTPPAIRMDLDWSVPRLIQMLETWSAVTRARADGHSATLDDLMEDAVRKFGDAPRRVSMPLTIVAGRVA
ncbi:class I SAM-dependent methyltransferase [Parvularcula sp. ZS-1/3]|uniref:Class I SAM-dependent methyltransferase n=1 Tax=Parvularcula mediterranea TaxID=2732508 RepID=A0A7Y3RJJ1_9PROT|nr:class I SAM-dependent methyltransferase [Parvularcula mediterranea]NNU15238.1 class I SAM-dependent methyltransferase [Parvularcula mediterranea]